MDRERFVIEILDGMAREGMSALGPCVPASVRPVFDRFLTEYGADQRPVFRLKNGSMVASGAVEFRFSIAETRSTSACFVRDSEGTWRVGRGTVRRVRRSSDAVVGLSDDVNTLQKLASELADARRARRLRVYLGAVDDHLPLSVYSGFAVSNARLVETRVLDCQPDNDDERAGAITIEGVDEPIPIRLSQSDGLLTSIAGRKPLAFFENWLEAIGRSQSS